MKRGAKAVWKGSVKEGKGKLSTNSKVLDGTNYSFHTRFEDGDGTNPEELVAAAHAGCFAMQLSAFLSEEGNAPESLEADCDVTFEDGEIKESALKLNAVVPGIVQSKFDELVKKAKENCPISKLYNTEISVDAKLSD
jgi:osmotically inducible protein OsmC